MTTAEQINEMVDLYNQTELIAQNMPILQEMRKKLVVLAYKLGHETAKYKREFDSSYALRKIGFFRLKKEHLNEGVSKAETLAESQITELRQTEKENEGMYSGCNIILKQVNLLIQSITQDISILKQEFDNELN